MGTGQGKTGEEAYASIHDALLWGDVKMFLYMNGSIDQAHEESLKYFEDATALEMDIRAVGKKLGQSLSKIGYVHEPDHVVVGTGGDFDEFGLAVLHELAPEGKSAAGCLWPHRGSEPKTLFFEQEYFEPEARHAPWAVVAISVANDYSIIQPLIRRVRELLPDARLILVAACATDEVHEQLKLQGVGMLAGVRRNVEDINYWDVVERLDRRELKIIPRMTTWLVDRMEARAAMIANAEKFNALGQSK